MDHNSMIAVLTAHRDGQEIEWRSVNFDTTWKPYGARGRFAFDQNEYRVKPETPEPPKPREWWINNYNGTANIFDSPEKAFSHSSVDCPERAIHVREVLPDKEWKA